MYQYISWRTAGIITLVVLVGVLTMRHFNPPPLAKPTVTFTNIWPKGGGGTLFTLNWPGGRFLTYSANDRGKTVFNVDTLAQYGQFVFVVGRTGQCRVEGSFFDPEYVVFGPEVFDRTFLLKARIGQPKEEWFRIAGPVSTHKGVIIDETAAYVVGLAETDSGFCVFATKFNPVTGEQKWHRAKRIEQFDAKNNIDAFDVFSRLDDGSPSGVAIEVRVQYPGFEKPSIYYFEIEPDGTIHEFLG